MLAVDDKTRFKLSGFAKKKSDMGVFMKEVLRKVHAEGYTTKYVRCDNAGENGKQLKEACEEFKKLQLEFTAPYTPQPNGIVERAFVTIRDMAHAMMIDAKLNEETRKLLWAEAVNYATDIANLVVLSTGDKTPQELFFGKKTNI